MLRRKKKITVEQARNLIARAYVRGSNYTITLNMAYRYADGDLKYGT